VAYRCFSSNTSIHSRGARPSTSLSTAAQCTRSWALFCSFLFRFSMISSDLWDCSSVSSRVWVALLSSWCGRMYAS